jgi:hypothetical protein
MIVLIMFTFIPSIWIQMKGLAIGSDPKWADLL